MAEIQHPIHLARLILDYSTKPLSLRRVPPNLLAGPGATDFAESLQLPILPPDSLVSDSARARWLKWARDLQAADSREDEGAEISQVSVAQAGPPIDHQLSNLPPYSSSEDQSYSLGKAMAGSSQANPPVLRTPQSTYIISIDFPLLQSDAAQLLMKRLLRQVNGCPWMLRIPQRLTM